MLISNCFREEDFRDQLKMLQQKFTQSREELAKCKQDVSDLEDRLRRKEIEVQDISAQVSYIEENKLYFEQNQKPTNLATGFL